MSLLVGVDSYPTEIIGESKVNYDKYWKEKRGENAGELSPFQLARAIEVHRFRVFFGRTTAQWQRHPGEHLCFCTLKDLNWWVSVTGKKLEKIGFMRGSVAINRLWPSL